VTHFNPFSGVIPEDIGFGDELPQAFLQISFALSS
jgi:hypothetical protein